MKRQRKSYKWFRFPGNFYAGNFPDAQPTIQAARQWLRDYLKVKRLPNGTEIW